MIPKPLNFDTFTGKSPLGADRYLLTALQLKQRYYLVSRIQLMTED